MDWVYWSSTTYDVFESPSARGYAWAACYNGGVWSYTQYELKTYAGGRVLAVRGGL